MKIAMRYMTTLLVLGAAAVAAGASARAETLLAKHGDWEAFTDREQGKLVCYIGTVPTKSAGKYTTRGRTFLLVTHRPAEKSTNVISLQAGYPYKKGSEVEVAIGKAALKLFTDDDWAFAPNAAADSAMVKAMIRGSTMVVKGTSSRGTLTTDTYSLSGFTAAYKAIGQACKV